MAKRFPELSDEHRAFLAHQHIFFTATAASTGRVNVSPRPTTALRVLSANAVAYLDRTGSGNETAAHLRQCDRMTLMVCAVEGPPLILRLYGKGAVLRRDTAAYAALLDSAFSGEEPAGARQIVRLDIDLVQTSCGYGVPLFEYKGERPSLDNWSAAKTAEEMEAYQRANNQVSLDGFASGMFEGT
ncbi:pyridoxamine 5'-phosphate oxidase family protein [Polymorphum gilvum]|uniref:Signal transduction histidine kinase, nitrogen specific n=1 Tax=Polymorphum gilvum (strain LMG 25793 / CGMCC 1.9160 / SL003B-26A1) TaxID=991905 RepID=F2J1E0_POLGS|nr:pyridoxamine 5'-phosphate oxidase family protein [Polymorphum gilvum]ADZ69722.1 Signal transduction histidine kinase, nitrogen specific [Polymorphum gilvum SL003B-26A1]